MASTERTAAILAGEQFSYEVVGYGRTAAEALAWAQAWQGQQASGPGSALYGRTVPSTWGVPYQPAWLTEARGRGHQEWRVPVQWVAAWRAPVGEAELAMVAEALAQYACPDCGQPPVLTRELCPTCAGEPETTILICAGCGWAGDQANQVVLEFHAGCTRG